jgi:hypothetical protein
VAYRLWREEFRVKTPPKPGLSSRAALAERLARVYSERKCWAFQPAGPYSPYNNGFSGLPEGRKTGQPGGVRDYRVSGCFFFSDRTLSQINVPIAPRITTRTIKKVVVSKIIGQPRVADPDRSEGQYAPAPIGWIPHPRRPAYFG